MLQFLFVFQIFMAVVISVIIILQNSNSDGIITSGSGKINHVSQNTFVNKLIMILIFIFMGNSLILSRYSIRKLKDDHPIINSLETTVTQNDKRENINIVPNME